MTKTSDGKPILIGIGGKLAAGKDTVADYLVTKHDFVKMGMSDPLHAALLTLNPWIWVSPEEATALALVRGFNKYASLTEELGYTAAKTIQEYREALQLLGDDVARQQWDVDHWVKVAETNIKKQLAEGKSVIQTAIRYPNELEMIQRLGGYLVWVERPAEGSTGAPIAQHASEHSVSKDDFQIVLNNRTDVAALYEMTEYALPTLPSTEEVLELRASAGPYGHRQ